MNQTLAMHPSRRCTDTDTHAVPAIPHRNGPVRRMAVAPFELAVALLSIWAGVSGLLGWSVSAVVSANMVPSWQWGAINLLYAFAGVSIAAGVLFKVRQIEAAGLMMLGFSVVIRTAINVAAVGLTPLFYGVVINAVVVSLAVALRLWVILGGRAVMLAEVSRAEDIGDAVVTRTI